MGGRGRRHCRGPGLRGEEGHRRLWMACSDPRSRLERRRMGLPAWCAVHKEYLVPPGRYSFSLLLSPLPAGSSGGDEAAQRETAAWKALL